jgi:hypothetical protein
MTTVLAAAQAAQAARNVALSKVAEALVADTSRLDAAKQAYDNGLAAELGKWPQWIAFAETVGVKADDLNHSKEEVPAFRSALDTIMDCVVRPAWASATVAARVAEEKQLRAAGKEADADAVTREIQSARTRRTELANVIRYGASVGRYVLDRMAQEGELAGVHKATVWASVFSGCNKRAAAIREAGGVITADDLYSVAGAVLDGARKPDRTDEQKRRAAAKALRDAVDKCDKLNVLDVAEVRKLWAIINRNPQTQEEATEAEAEVKPVTRKSEPAPAAKPAKGKVATPPRKASEQTTPRSKAELKADTAKDDAAMRATVDKVMADVI